MTSVSKDFSLGIVTRNDGLEVKVTRYENTQKSMDHEKCINSFLE